jgi:hypothetical protein
VATRLKSSTIGWALMAVGLIFALPSSALLITDPPDADQEVAFAPALRIPLDSLKGGYSVRVVLTVPFHWRKMHSQWGEPVYLVLVRLQDRSFASVAYEKLGIDLTVTRGGQVLELQPPSGTPYAHNPDTDKLGFVFKPSPGDELSVNVAVRSDQPLPRGELIVEPFADGFAKDRIAGAMVDADVRPWAKRLLPSGLMMIAVGALVAFATRRSNAA